MTFPLTTDEVKTWIWSALGDDEKKSAELIMKIVEQNEIDGKLLILLYKYPHEFVSILPDFRSRLLLMNALDVLVKAVGKKLPAVIKTCSMPTASLLSRLTSNKYSESSNSFSRNQSSFDGNAFNCKSSRYFVDKKPGKHWHHLGGVKETINPSSQTHHAKQSMLANNEGDGCEREIPTPVPLPVFDQALQQAIDAGRLRERCIRSRMSNACARFYASIKMYPTLIDYHRICERLVEKYPDLKDADTKSDVQPWNQLKKLLSMSFCNVRRIMKVKDLMNARHFITSIQRRYKAFGKYKRHAYGAKNFIDDSSTSSGDEFLPHRKIILPVPSPIPSFDSDLHNAIIEGKLKDRPWSSQFYRRCAKFYTKLKPYPSRRDYKNISEHLAKVFPTLGASNCIKRLLSQHIRSHRQTRKLWKLNQQQKAKMLRLQRTHKGEHFKSVDEGNSLPSGNGSVSTLYNPYEHYEYQSNNDRSSMGEDQNIHSSYYNEHYVSSSEREVPATSADVKNDIEIITNLSKHSSLQYPVPLPSFDDAMIKGIREGQLQERTLRIRFIRLCANFYLGIKNYPTKEEYNNICRTIVTKFPDLGDPSPLSGCPPFMLFKKALTACIRNKRRDNIVPNPSTSSWHSLTTNNTNSSNNFVKIERNDDRPYHSNSTAPSSALISDQTIYSNAPFFNDQPPLVLPLHSQMETNSGVMSPDVVSHNHPIRHISSVNSSTETFADSRGEYNQINSSLLNSNFVSANNFIDFQVPLPVFAPDVSNTLSTGQRLIGEIKLRFLQTCADFYLHGKSYNCNDVNAICLQLVQSYPQLADSNVSILGKQLTFNDLKKELMDCLNECRSKNMEKEDIKESISHNLSIGCERLPSVTPSFSQAIDIPSQSFSLIVSVPPSTAP